MPRRSPASLLEVTSRDNLLAAFGLAARASHFSTGARRFAASLEPEIACLRDDIFSGRAPEGRWSLFWIHDPKLRRILAPSFRDRILHHAMMRVMAPVLERSLVDDTFACRTGKGTLAAVHRAQAHARRSPWFVKADVRSYFASIDHGVLAGLLRRRFRDPGLLGLCERVLSRVPDGPGRGLPIGALTSQWFANVYLDGLDRWLLEGARVRGMVRYMDDVVWWCDDRAEAHATLGHARDYLARERRLELRDNAQIGRSECGVPFLGFRVSPGTLRLSLRRRRRYRIARAWWEGAFARGAIGEHALQAGYSSALAITAHAHARDYRAAELRRRPPVDV